mmetsp:Transcript_74805/g.196185  ORF Transcript_74805/g.196185 Transcript_74805/m.196185 type:complete len:241 (+) Transcript_74805:2589-3311(+)
MRGAVGGLVIRGTAEPRAEGLVEVLGAAEEAVVVRERQGPVPLRRAEEAVAVLHAHSVDDPGVGSRGHEQSARIHVQHVGVPDQVRHVVEVPTADVDVGLDALDLEDDVREVLLPGLVLVVDRDGHPERVRRLVRPLAHRLRERDSLVRDRDGARALCVQKGQSADHVLAAGRKHREDVAVALVVEALRGAAGEEDAPEPLGDDRGGGGDAGARRADHEVEVREARAGRVEHLRKKRGGT